MTFRLFSPICESKETRKCDTNHTTNYVMNTVKYSQNEPRNTMKRLKILGEEGEGEGAGVHTENITSDTSGNLK